MEMKEPSGSAILAAMTRAAHLILDDEPKILRDDLALRLSGLQDETALRSELENFYSEMARNTTPEFAQAFSRSYRAFALLRQRYTEDELGKALGRGISQFVIMGAGLDSFAYRRRDLEDKLRVFEIDHPASQEWKKARLQALGITLPRNLAFVPIDFEKETLMDELSNNGFRKEAPAFFSWLGVTQYLTEAAVFKTLREVASAAPGSEIIFEYVLPETLLNDGDRQMVAGGKKRPSEPWISTFAPNDLTERLREIGFVEVMDFGLEEATRLYFDGRIDELSSSILNELSSSILRIGHLMKARVSDPN